MKLLSLITNNQIQVLVLMLTGVTVVVKNRSCASVSQLQLWCGETVAEAGFLVVFFTVVRLNRRSGRWDLSDHLCLSGLTIRVENSCVVSHRASESREYTADVGKGKSFRSFNPFFHQTGARWLTRHASKHPFPV